jgi:hypothetical protein
MALARRRSLRDVSMAACLTGAGALVHGPAMAGVWTLEPQLSTSAEYESNPQLRATPAYGYSAALLLGLPASWDDGARHLDVSPSARLAKAGGDYFSKTDAFYLSSTGSVQSERSAWKATAQWSSDSTVLLEPSAGTLTRRDFPRRTAGASADWTTVPSQRATLDVTASDQVVRYSDALAFGLYDYRNLGLTASAAYAVAERYQLQLIAGTSRYEASEVGFRSLSSYLEGGIVGHPATRWSYTALFGVSRAAVDAGPQSPTGSVYQFSLSRTNLTTTLTASASRSLQPSAFGTVVRSTELALQGSWQASERTSLMLAARSARTADVFGTVAFAGQSYASVRAAASWRASELWTLDAALSWQRARLNPGDILTDGRGGTVTATRRFGKVAVR